MAFENLTLPPVRFYEKSRFRRRQTFGESTLNPGPNDGLSDIIAEQIKNWPTVRVASASDWDLPIIE